MLSLFLSAALLISYVNGQTCTATAYLNNNCGGAISIPYSFTTNGQCTAPEGLASCYFTATCQGNGISVTIYDSNGCGNPQYQPFLALDTNACQQFNGCNNAFVKMNTIDCCTGAKNLNQTRKTFTKVIDDFEEFILHSDDDEKKKILL